MKKLLNLFAGTIFLLFSLGAEAAITCSINTGNYTQDLNLTFTRAETIQQLTFTVTCQRNAVGDPGSVTYYAFVNNGGNPTGGTNKAFSGGNSISYETYTNTCGGTRWRPSSQIPQPSGTLALSGLTPNSVTHTYWLCATAGGTKPAGTYNDTVIMTLDYGVPTTTTTLNVNFHVPKRCSITSPPTTLNISYTSLQTGNATGNSNFGLTCNAAVPYTFSVTPPSGTISGINYSLSLPAGGTGNGVQQNYSITGTALGNQAGTCAGATCSGTQSTTLTVTW